MQSAKSPAFGAGRDASKPVRGAIMFCEFCGSGPTCIVCRRGLDEAESDESTDIIVSPGCAAILVGNRGDVTTAELEGLRQLARCGWYGLGILRAGR
jgi:hypothetical protein